MDDYLDRRERERRKRAARNKFFIKLLLFFALIAATVGIIYAVANHGQEIAGLIKGDKAATKGKSPDGRATTSRTLTSDERPLVGTWEMVYGESVKEMLTFKDNGSFVDLVTKGNDVILDMAGSWNRTGETLTVKITSIEIDTDSDGGFVKVDKGKHSEPFKFEIISCTESTLTIRNFAQKNKVCTYKKI